MNLTRMLGLAAVILAACGGSGDGKPILVFADGGACATSTASNNSAMLSGASYGLDTTASDLLVKELLGQRR